LVCSQIAVKSSKKEKQAMKKILVVALVVAIALIGVTAAFAANHTTMSCRVCHTPHNSLDMTTAPLWDTTARTTATGSNLCIACHNGSYTMAAVAAVWSDGGTNDHPVNVGPGNYGTVGMTSVQTLNAANLVECQSCHYVHNDPAITGAGNKYVRNAMTCNGCHVAW
jgi:hypothetical protein